MEKIPTPMSQESYENELASRHERAGHKEKLYGIPADNIIWHKRDIHDAEKAKDIISSGKVAVIIEKQGEYCPSGSILDVSIDTTNSEVIGFNSKEDAKKYMRENAEPREETKYNEGSSSFTINDKGRSLYMVIPGNKLFSIEKKYDVIKNEAGKLEALKPAGYYFVEITENGRVGIPDDQLNDPVFNEPRKMIDNREALFLRVIKSKSDTIAE